MRAPPALRTPTLIQRQATAAKSAAAPTEISSCARAPCAAAVMAARTAPRASTENHPAAKVRNGCGIRKSISASTAVNGMRTLDGSLARGSRGATVNRVAADRRTPPLLAG